MDEQLLENNGADGGALAERAPPGKRVRKSIEEKLEIIDFVESGGTHNAAAAKFGVSRSAVTNFMKDRDVIREACRSSGPHTKRSKIIKAKERLSLDPKNAMRLAEKNRSAATSESESERDDGGHAPGISHRNPHDEVCIIDTSIGSDEVTAIQHVQQQPEARRSGRDVDLTASSNSTDDHSDNRQSRTNGMDIIPAATSKPPSYPVSATTTAFTSARSELSHLVYPVYVSSGKDDVQLDAYPSARKWGHKGDETRSIAWYASLVHHLQDLQLHGLVSVLLLRAPNDSLAKDENDWMLHCVRALADHCPHLVILCDINPHDLPQDTSIDTVALRYVRSNAAMIYVSDSSDPSIIKRLRNVLDVANLRHIPVIATIPIIGLPGAQLEQPSSSVQTEGISHLASMGWEDRTNRICRSFDELQFAGADAIVLHPCLFYGDLVKTLVDRRTVPVGCFVVASEYRMLQAYDPNGEIVHQVMEEAHASLIRAGARMIISYCTPHFTTTQTSLPV